MQYDKLRDSNKTAAATVKGSSGTGPPARDKKPVEESSRPDTYTSSNTEKIKDPSKQKQQIKLTLLNKASSLSKREVDLSKVKIEKEDSVRSSSKVSSSGTKRPLSPPSSSAKMSSSSAPKRSTSSRRDELLKQLKAVEDAIARKRAKFSWKSLLYMNLFFIIANIFDIFTWCKTVSFYKSLEMQNALDTTRLSPAINHLQQVVTWPITLLYLDFYFFNCVSRLLRHSNNESLYYTS